MLCHVSAAQYHHTCVCTVSSYMCLLHSIIIHVSAAQYHHTCVCAVSSYMQDTIHFFPSLKKSDLCWKGEWELTSADMFEDFSYSLPLIFHSWLVSLSSAYIYIYIYICTLIPRLTSDPANKFFGLQRFFSLFFGLG